MSAVFVFVGVHFNLLMVAVCLVSMQLISAPIAWRITVQPLIGGGFWEYFFISYRVLGLALLIALPIYIFAYNVMNFWIVFALAIVYAIIYLACMFIKYPDSYVVSLLRKLYSITLFKK